MFYIGSVEPLLRAVRWRWSGYFLLVIEYTLFVVVFLGVFWGVPLLGSNHADA